jgi:hypothetical protein
MNHGRGAVIRESRAVSKVNTGTARLGRDGVGAGLIHRFSLIYLVKKINNWVWRLAHPNSHKPEP